MPDEISHSYQMMIFWAGLRGAVGVALAMDLVGKQNGHYWLLYWWLLF